MLKFLKNICEKINDFVNLNRTFFIISWYYYAFLVVINPQYWVSFFHIIGIILNCLILITKFMQWVNRKSFINFLFKSPLNIVIGSLGTGKTALLVFASKLLGKKKWKTASTFPILDQQMLSLGHMSLLDNEYPILEEKHLLLWDETNLFLEGTDYKENDKSTQGLQEYFALVRHFGHIVLASGQRPEHIWVKVRDIANSVIVGITKKSVNIFRPYLKVVYGTFKSVEEYERWRTSLIDAKNNKKGRKTKYRNIPELDIYFFKLKIPMSVLECYDNKYLSFLRPIANRIVVDTYEDKFYETTEVDLEILKYLKMEKFSRIMELLKSNLKDRN
ncbi:hypothetical protein [Spiroplasma endosymbiont of Tipula paludosa]|uniref:hypothetical protein n=1 Tax=Spiroplasma endosymbiont of Tipula paludosa TaxID=3066295 RepID=UPI0035C8C0C2